MMEKIKSITEAFSMQPISFRICEATEDYSHYQTKGKPHNHMDSCIEKIVPESRQVNSDKVVNYYVGYDFEGNKRFEFPQETVSVEYLQTQTK